MDLTHFYPQFISVFTNIYIIIEAIYYIYKIRKVLEINDDFGAFWRYFEQAPEMTISVDIGEINSIDTQDMVLIDSKTHRSTFGHSRLEAQDFTILQDCP